MHGKSNPNSGTHRPSVLSKLYQPLYPYMCVMCIYCITRIIGEPYIWRIYSKIAINGILNWQFCVLYGNKSMVIVLMVYIKFSDHYMIRQTANLK